LNIDFPDIFNEFPLAGVEGRLDGLPLVPVNLRGWIFLEELKFAPSFTPSGLLKVVVGKELRLTVENVEGE
jgi:hypothetical protein